ncbi:PREDICTED: uncharacterized protein LOC108616500 [Drosophila arizonae]|uniref:Uncharacterized protein LOC108616500 n=1 Tax=Drosophila arizonae TaxID=7263 RepID=A0ABM1PJ38_DROAR|nr:PREDICTED: uncharacterized protein LOC108616500 [Drosophila arizonae]
MSKYLDLGLGITIINVYYSLSYFLMWCVALQKASDNDSEPIVWQAVYMGNVFLNVFLFLGLRKRDRWSVIIWYSLTLVWFVPKLYGHKRGCHLDARGSTYRTINLIMETYVILSFAVMALVYVHLPKELPLTKNKRRRYSSNGHVQDVQMLELNLNGAAKAPALAPLATAEVDDDLDECLPSSSNCHSNSNNNRGMQQVSSIEFHQADDAELDKD